MTESIMSEFVRDRLDALRSLDEEKIRAYARKYGARFPGDDDPVVFWGAVHNARMVLPGLTDKERDVSFGWLMEHGMSVRSARQFMETRARHQEGGEEAKEDDNGG